MLIAWLKKFSLLDFPGKVSCIIFTPSCDFRCSFCHNPELVLPELLKETNKKLINLEDFFAFLETRRGLLDWISICWWEPTLQKWLVEFCEKIKSMWFVIKLDTNWTNPKVLKELLDKKLLNYVAMDYKHNLEKLDDLVKVKVDKQKFNESTKLLLNWDIDYEFRTTIIKWVHTSEDIEEISKSISWAKNYFLQNFESWNMIDPNFRWTKFYSKELEHLKEVAEKYVKKVWIRD